MENFFSLNDYVKSIQEYKKWIDTEMPKYRNDTCDLRFLCFRRATKYFPDDIVANTKVVVLSNNEELPLHPMEKKLFTTSVISVMYNYVIFTTERFLSESLIFHELVHCVQQKTLGNDNYISTYCSGIFNYVIQLLRLNFALTFYKRNMRIETSRKM